MAKELLDLVIKCNGWKTAELTAEADPNEPEDLRQLLVDAIKRDGQDERQIGEYEMEVHYREDASVLLTFVASA